MGTDFYVNRGQQQQSLAILFGLAPHGDGKEPAAHLAELERLSHTCGFRTVGHLIQHRRSPDPNKYMGAGKLQELRELIESTGAELAVCNDTLNPSQGKNVGELHDLHAPPDRVALRDLPPAPGPTQDDDPVRRRGELRIGQRVHQSSFAVFLLAQLEPKQLDVGVALGDGGRAQRR